MRAWPSSRAAADETTLHLTLAFIAQKTRGDLHAAAIQQYIDRTAAYTGIEARAFRDEATLLTFVQRQRTRTPAWLVLMDSRGESWSSEHLAVWLGARRDGGQQAVIFAIGPPNGWSAAAQQQAQTLVSLGPMTLPHELARLVLAEQLYRAFTIMAAHPYHLGH